MTKCNGVVTKERGGEFISVYTPEFSDINNLCTDGKLLEI
jgi:hypothetical protein